MKIALDVMGGDHGPAPAIEGALQAAQECDVEVLLVGDEAIITAECRRLGCTDSRLSIRHASQVVEMHESPATVARKKRNSSIWIATELVKSGEASAVVSPGNTGASMVASFFVLGLTKGVERPAIATSLPTLTGTAIMLDVGEGFLNLNDLEAALGYLGIAIAFPHSIEVSGDDLELIIMRFEAISDTTEEVVLDFTDRPIRREVVTSQVEETPASFLGGAIRWLKPIILEAQLLSDGDRKSTRLNSSHGGISRMPSSA